MLVFAHSSSDHNAPREPQRRGRGAIVWQAHTEGFATTAYRDGHAIAGISGPWSNQYVLIWWQSSQPIREVEVFDSLEEAKQAVALGSAPRAPTHLDALLARLRRDYATPRPNWLERIRGALKEMAMPRAHATLSARGSRRRALSHDEQTDLRGLNIRAVR